MTDNINLMADTYMGNECLWEMIMDDTSQRFGPSKRASE